MLPSEDLGARHVEQIGPAAVVHDDHARAAGRSRDKRRNKGEERRPPDRRENKVDDARTLPASVAAQTLEPVECYVQIRRASVSAASACSVACSHTASGGPSKW